jgi:general secretion pathway protein I
LKGFTLLEVMVSLAIIAGVLMTVYSSFGFHLDVAGRDREETVVMLLARSKIDGSRLLGEKTGNGTFAPSWPEITWELATDPAPWPGVERLNLTVYWDQRKKNLKLTHYREKLL